MWKGSLFSLSERFKRFIYNMYKVSGGKWLNESCFKFQHLPGFKLCIHVYLWLPVILFRLYFWPWQKIHSSGNMWHFLHYLCSPLTQIAAFIFAVALLHLGEKLDHHLVRSYLFPHLNNVNENKNKEKITSHPTGVNATVKNTHYKTSWTLRGCKF